MHKMIKTYHKSICIRELSPAASLLKNSVVENDFPLDYSGTSSRFKKHFNEANHNGKHLHVIKLQAVSGRF
jgi:hypothetical protein